MMDLTSARVIRSIQQRFGFTFKKGLGQNFLTSDGVLSEIADAALTENGVLEIGPGFGVLTAALAEKGGKVVAVEIDERLLDVLEYTLADFDNVKIIHGDIMKLNIGQLIHDEFGDKRITVAANLPYYITTPIITRLLEGRLPLDSIVVMVQKEVAERLTAREGTKDYGAITVMCRYYTEPEIITKVPASLFVPPPKVDSAVLKLNVLEKPAVDVDDESIFFRVVKSAFSQRRKTLLNCLCASFSVPKAVMSEKLQNIGIEPTRRGETLTLDEFAAVAGIIINEKEKL